MVKSKLLCFHPKKLLLEGEMLYLEATFLFDLANRMDRFSQTPLKISQNTTALVKRMGVLE